MARIRLMEGSTQIVGTKLSDRERQRIRREADRERHNAIRREWAAANPEKKKESNRRWRERNKEKARQIAKASYQKHREKRCMARRIRDKRYRQVDGSFSANDIQRIYQAQDSKCAICKSSIRKAFQIDHIMPLTLGGSNHPSNIQLLCQPCNARKGGNDPLEYMQSLGRLL